VDTEEKVANVRWSQHFVEAMSSKVILMMQKESRVKQSFKQRFKNQVSSFKIQDSRIKFQVSRFKIQESRFKNQDWRKIKIKIQDSRFKNQEKTQSR